MIKLVFFIPDLGGGGAEKVITNIMSYAESNYSSKYELYLLVNNFCGPYQDKISTNVHVYELKKKNIILSVFKVASILKKIEPDLLISTVRGANLVTALSRFLFRKYIWVLREANTFTNPSVTKSSKAKFIDFLCYLFYFKADYLIANSPDTKSDLINRCFFLNPDKVYVLPNPVFYNSLLKKSDAVIEDRVEHIYHLISVGRLVPQKNFELLINAVNLLVRSNLPVKLDIYGSGFLEPVLNRQISDLQLENHVEIIPFKKDIMSIYSRYDLFVLSSKWEGFGNVLVEAMSQGLPIVSTDCPGGPRFILPTSNNMVMTCKSDNIDDMVEKITFSLEQNYSLEDVQSIIDYSQQFSVEVVADGYLKLISTFIKEYRI